MNMREILNYKNGYYEINREERNLAAILYHTLLFGNNLKRFLDKINCEFQIVEHEMGIYFEYAFIRDLWASIDKKDEKLRRKLILDLLKPNNRSELEKLTIFQFNDYFGAVREGSNSHFIQSPGNWSMLRFDKNISDNEEFLRTCKFKWCFKAIPDIVIHISHDTAVCIETKLESPEGKYPSSEKEEKDIFTRRNHDRIGQCDVQKMIMEEMLGIKSDFVFILKKKKSSSKNKDKTTLLTWKEAFEGLDIVQCPFFIREWINNL